MKARPGRLTTIPITSTEEVKLFFDRFAPDYSERHGSPRRLLNTRLNLIRKWTNPGLNDVVLDLGCGNGHHLIALHKNIGRGIGIDFSRVMIEVAKERMRKLGSNGNLSFQMDDARVLSTIGNQSIDIAMCIGSLEHMLDQGAVLNHAHRVLKPGGRFICLTPNGDNVWYRRIAPRLGLDTRHLSSDRFLTESECRDLLSRAGFQSVEIGRWTFVPRGDVYPIVGSFLTALEIMGRLLGMKDFHGGLVASAVKGGRRESLDDRR